MNACESALPLGRATNEPSRCHQCGADFEPWWCGDELVVDTCPPCEKTPAND